MCSIVFLELCSVSTSVDELVVANKVYQNYPILISHKVIPCGLVEHDMVDFNIILGMDWLHSSYASIDCITHRVKFQFPNKHILVWKGSNLVFKSWFISCLKTHKLIAKGMTNYEVPSSYLVPIVNEFPDIFHDNLPSVPHKREINSSIGLLLDAQPISIPLYHIDLEELKESKEQLKDLLEIVSLD